MMNKELSEYLFKDINTIPKDMEGKYPKRTLKENAMVTRLGPSPTGFIHIGNLYSAFICYVMAKQSDGVFYLRIEDTDSKREVEGAADLIIDALNSFDITYDEGYEKGGDYGPYKQSMRTSIYQTYVKSLIEQGLAYPCFMTEEELTQIREEQEIEKLKIGIYGHYALDRNLSNEEVMTKIKQGEDYVIRLKSPGNNNTEIELDDAVKGRIKMPENELDIVLLKKDGTPTYHLAHVIDDHLMRTTHVIRGDEWVSSFPVHYQLTNLLGFDLPVYAHIAPLTKKENGNVRKLSKRKDPEFAVSYYEATGIPVEAIHLYFATLSNTNFEEWYNENPDKEIKDFTFTFDKMPVGGTLFDLEKLTSISKIYLSRLSAEEIYHNALLFTKQFDPEYHELLTNNKERMIQFLNIEKDGPRPRKDIATYHDIKTEFSYAIDSVFFETGFDELDKNDEYDTDLMEEYFKHFDETLSKDEWFEQAKEFALKHGYTTPKEYKKNPDEFKGHIGNFCEMIRVSVTGRKQTPDLYSILVILGKENILKRFELFKETLLKK